MNTFPRFGYWLLGCAALCLPGVMGCGAASTPETVFAKWSAAVKAGNFRGTWECLSPQTRGTVLQILVRDADLLSSTNTTAKTALGQVFEQHGLNPLDPGFAQQRLAVTDPANLAADLDNVFRQYLTELGKLPESRYAKLNAIWTASAQSSLSLSRKQGTRATAAVQGKIPHTPETASLQAVFEQVNNQWMFAELEPVASAPVAASTTSGTPGTPGSTMPGMPATTMPAGTQVAMTGDPAASAASAGTAPSSTSPASTAPATTTAPSSTDPASSAPATTAPATTTPATTTPPTTATPATPPTTTPADPAVAGTTPADPNAAAAKPAMVDPANPAAGNPGAAANGNPGGVAQPGAPSEKRESQHKQGTLDYAITEFAGKIAAGDYAGLEYVISSKAKGLLAEIRDGEISDDKKTELKATFASATPQENTRKNKGSTVEIYLKGKLGHMLQLSVGKEDGVFKIRELKIHEPGATKKR